MVVVTQGPLSKKQMNDRELLHNIQNYRRQGVEVALVTVVKARGSTPRAAGAKMALLPNGKSLGTIGGGCIEARIKNTALKALISEHQSQVIVSHLNDDPDSDGDVCGGTMTILVEYLPPLTEINNDFLT